MDRRWGSGVCFVGQAVTHKAETRAEWCARRAGLLDSAQLNNTHGAATALAVYRVASHGVAPPTHFLPALAPLAAATGLASSTLAWLSSDRMTFQTTAQVLTAATCATGCRGEGGEALAAVGKEEGEMAQCTPRANSPSAWAARSGS